MDTGFIWGVMSIFWNKTLIAMPLRSHLKPPVEL